MTDRRLVLACAAALFLLSAWPLLLVTLPPYQDVPNHLAAVTVLDNPALYPEYVSNGFFKTNAAVFAWCHSVGKFVGPVTAMRLFIVIVLGAGAVAFPTLLLVVAGRRSVVTGSLLAAPMVHNWFVSMGMLDFALGVALAVLDVAAMERQRRAPSIRGGALVLALSVATWWAHSFPLLCVHVLFAIEALVTLRRSFAEARRLVQVVGVPLAGSALLAILRHTGDGPARGGVELLSPWEGAYALWAQWTYGFTVLGAITVVPAVVLVILALARRKQAPSFFSPPAFAALAILYVLTPHQALGWFYVNARIAPFLWMAMLVRVPDRLPRPITAAVAAVAILSSLVLAVDFVRLDRERASFDAGIPHVPEGARLLPIVFDRKGASDNTRHLAQAWGTYVVRKHTAAPLVFATSRSYAVSYREPPPPELDQVAFEGFVGTMRTAASFCADANARGKGPADCRARYEERWADFYRVITPRFDHLLTWGASPEARASVPDAYRPVFEQGELVVYERR